MIETPAAKSSATTVEAAIRRVVDTMAANGVSLPMLASALGYESTPIAGSLRRTEKFEDAFRDPETREICRRGGPWRMWVARRLERGIGFSDLVVDRSKLAFLLQAFCKADNE